MASQDGVVDKELTGEPGGLATIARAALPLLPVVNRLPGVRKAPRSSYDGLAYHRAPVTVERDHVEAYAAVCGFPVKDTVPLPYPHVLAFGLHTAIMTDPAFPFPAVGTVHMENDITSHRPVRVGEALGLRVEASEARPHAKGTALVFSATATVGDETVWESTSTYLRRGKGDEAAPAGLRIETTPGTGVRWPLPADLGRRYAAVSGDHNPIHLHPLTAKPLGFPRHIAHGMWSLARCVAALENRLDGDGGARVQVAFKKPILLPGSVAFGSRPVADDGPGGYLFSLTSPKDGSPHLVGRTSRP
ncbi:MaoC/PaaZ C-terminal domain-containing protein [uncultured Nocardioides sp.]|uniref:MaoC/PaaZ C-terminal domain-containing protein n=1 Tax=uncultured Nocardioides sp. TaxID=198441 RepID=UPI002637CA03|nr:MaoC/PaaZ C-terminal domain-containing protein [uncultured Nocardioides sp.]